MKVIVHLDLDCFYAQVEAVRLGIDCRTVPFVVSQWGNLIAVNYPARAAGIIRFDTVATAQAKCPTVQYCHTASYAVGESEYKYHENPSKQSYKVSLEPYRIASIKIFNILASFPNVEVEKAGVDEAFLDVTAAVEGPAAELLRQCSSNDEDKNASDGKDEAMRSDAAIRDHLLRKISEFSSIIWPNEAALAPFRRPECPSKNTVKSEEHFGSAEGKQEQSDGLFSFNEEDFSPAEGLRETSQLAAASILVKAIRDKVRQELGYDCSGGIAQNKMLAKLISASNKPNKQTVLLPSATLSFMAGTKFEKIRGFGGKLGRQLGSVSDGAVLCGELWKHSKAWLAENMGGREEAEYIYAQLRGHCESQVAPRAVSKSLMAQKVFQPASRDISVLIKWLTVLAGELRSRWETFSALHGVTARHLNFRFGPASSTPSSDYGNMGGAIGDFNKTFPFPVPTTAERIIGIGSKYCAQLLQQYPCVKLISVTVSLGDFKRCRDDSSSTKPPQQQTTLSQAIRNAHASKQASAESKRCHDEVVIDDDDDEDGGEVKFGECNDDDDDVIVLDHYQAETSAHHSDVGGVNADNRKDVIAATIRVPLADKPSGIVGAAPVRSASAKGAVAVFDCDDVDGGLDASASSSDSDVVVCN